MMTLVRKNKMEILRKPIFYGILRVFLLAVLTLCITITQGMVTDASAVVHFSRACRLIGANESGTHNFSAKLGGWFWVNSHHLNYNYNTRRWEWQHKISSGWNGPNGTLDARRAVAGHYLEYWSAPGVVGYHYQWNAPANRVDKVWTSVNVICPDPS